MRYYKGRWDERRGDEFAAWGGSDRYFEVGADYWVVRQMEVYDAGVVLQYDERHREDRFGGLTDQPFEAGYYPVAPITREEFEGVWASFAPAHRG
jgi:hypothetical protein